jgi:hypothetical protein
MKKVMIKTEKVLGEDELPLYIAALKNTGCPRKVLVDLTQEGKASWVDEGCTTTYEVVDVDA